MSQKTDYTVNIGDMANVVIDAASRTSELLARFSPAVAARTDEQCRALHTQITDRYARLFDRLYHEFITPIERDDIARIGQRLCALTGSIGEISADLHRYRITDVPPALQTAVRSIVTCCEQLHRLLTAFWRFRKDNAWWGLKQTLCRDTQDSIRRLRDAADAPFGQIRYGLYRDAEQCFAQISDLAEMIAATVLKNI